MKKYLISASILAATISAVAAHEVAGTVSVDANNVMYTTSVTSAPAYPTGAQTVTLTAVPGAMPTKVMTGQAVAVRAMPITAGYHMGGVMTTGDTVVDGKIRVLEEERAKKLQAINVEYDAKVKAVIGNLKVTSYTTTSVSGVAIPSGAQTTGSQGGAVHVQNSATVNGEGLESTRGEAAVTISAHAELAPTGIKGFFWRLFH